MPDIDGTIIRLAMKNLLNTGIVSENELPYSLIETTTKLPEITDTLKTSAAKFKIGTYASVPLYDLDAMKRALTVSPVVVGLDAYDSFQYPEAGFLYPPSGRLLGGHCVLVVGYDDDLTHRYYEGKAKTGFFKIANSWGPYWGKGGFAHMSYEDFCQTNQIFELWSSVDAVVNPPQPEPAKFYKVQVGAFPLSKQTVPPMSKKSKPLDSQPMPPPDSKGIYRVQVGAFSVKENAVALKDKLLAAGFAGAFIVYA